MDRIRTSKAVFRAVTPLLAALLALATAEASLRMGGWWIRHREIERESQFTFAPDEFRIVTVGESTTAPNWSDRTDISWPRQLAELLNHAGLGKTVRVVNLAEAGTSTPFILHKLEEELPTLKPHLVISMMGINDNYAYDYLRPSFGFLSLRLVKLARGFWNARHSVSSLPPPSDVERTEILGAIARLDLGLGRSLDPAQLETFRTGIEALAQSHAKYSWFIYRQAGIGLLMQLGKKKQVNARERDQALGMTLRYIQRALEVNPTDLVTLRLALKFGNLTEHLEIARAMLRKALERGFEPDDPFLTLILNTGISDPMISGLLAARGMKRAKGSWYERTVGNYRALARLLRNNGVRYIAMQYPTGSVKALMNAFTSAPNVNPMYFGEAMYQENPQTDLAPEFKDVIFASNEDFNEIVTPANSSQYYIDHFSLPYHRFGHTTALGHELIAKNVARVIETHWAELAPRR